MHDKFENLAAPLSDLSPSYPAVFRDTSKLEPSIMTGPTISHDALDERDIATIRHLYTEAQNWTRHYEQLIVNANVLLVSAALIFVGLAFGDKVSTLQVRIILSIPVLMSFAGIVLTQTLFNLYATCIVRMIRLETLLGCFDSARFDAIDKGGSLLSQTLMKLPVTHPTSVRFFIGLHVLLIGAYIAITVLKW